MFLANFDPQGKDAISKKEPSLIKTHKIILINFQVKRYADIDSFKAKMMFKTQCRLNEE